MVAAKEEPSAPVGGASAIEMQHKNPKLDKLMVELRAALRDPTILRQVRHKLRQHMISSFNAIEKAQYDKITGPGSHDRMFEFRKNWMAKRLTALGKETVQAKDYQKIEKQMGKCLPIKVIIRKEGG